jgi:transcriptional regulator with XRE-family HTH domain
MATNPKAEKLLKFIKSHKLTIGAVAKMSKVSDGTLRSFRDIQGRDLNPRTKYSIGEALAWYTGQNIVEDELFEFGSEHQNDYGTPYEPPRNTELGKLLITRNIAVKELAERAGLGLTIIENLLNNSVPLIADDDAKLIALALNCTTKEIGYDGFKNYYNKYLKLDDERERAILEECDFEKNRPETVHHKLPIHEVKKGADGHIIKTSRIIGLTTRPPSFENNDEGYAVYMPDRSMYPRFDIGEILYVDPHKVPTPNSDVIVTSKSAAQDKNNCIIAILLGQEEQKSSFKFYNKNSIITVDNTDIDIHRIIRGADLLT